MNWKLILQLSLFGLVMGVSTVWCVGDGRPRAALRAVPRAPREGGCHDEQHADAHASAAHDGAHGPGDRALVGDRARDLRRGGDAAGAPCWRCGDVRHVARLTLLD